MFSLSVRDILRWPFSSRPLIARLKHFSLFVACAALSLAIAGCWDVGSQPVITSDTGQVIPYTAGNQYTYAAGVVYKWSPTGLNNDYRYQKMDGNGNVQETGLLRVMNIRDSIFAVQTKSDDSDSYDISLISITPTSISDMDIADADYPKTNGFAQSCGITWGGTYSNADAAAADNLHGTPDQILCFLRDLQNVSFQTSN